MKNLQEATERICELKGSLVALDVLVPALVRALAEPTRARLMDGFDAHAEAARTALLHADISDLVLAAFERDVARNRSLVERSVHPFRSEMPATVDPLLLKTTRITTFAAGQVLTSASGFFYRRGERVHLISNRHVFADAENAHHPDSVEIGVHTDAQDLTRHAVLTLPLWRDGRPLWSEFSDSGDVVDIAALEIPASRWPVGAAPTAFDETHLEARNEQVALGDALVIAGFPLGFFDTVFHLAVARSATIASAYGVRFQGRGYFLTDARTHRGSSGSPVVRRRLHDGESSPSWQLVGVHSTRMDMRNRDHSQDESLGLNCAWYADVLPALTRAA